MNKEEIVKAFNNAWNRKIARENSYGKLASKELLGKFKTQEEITMAYKQFEQLDKN